MIEITLTLNPNPNASNGLVCYIRKELKGKVQFVKDNSDNSYYKSKKVLEISCIRVMIKDEWHYIVYLYNHPDNGWKDFTKEFRRFIVDTVPNIGMENASPLYIVGDFNKDKKDVTEEHLKLFKEMKLKINKTKFPSTDRGTHIDWFLCNSANRIDIRPYFYESYFSDHKPLMFDIFF